VVAPYVGKIRPVLARHLIKSYSNPKSIVYDPFCGSGTVPLEAWISGHKCFGTDINDYAITLTKGKLEPYNSLDDALRRLDRINSNISKFDQKPITRLQHGSKPFSISEPLLKFRFGRLF
jgi:tRNA G10  N-methylase Trm11